MLTHSFSHIGNRYWWISPLHYKGFTPNSPSAMLGALESSEGASRRDHYPRDHAGTE